MFKFFTRKERTNTAIAEKQTLYRWQVVGKTYCGNAVTEVTAYTQKEAIDKVFGNQYYDSRKYLRNDARDYKATWLCVEYAYRIGEA